MKKHAFHQHFRPFRCIKHCKLQCFVLVFFQKPPPHGGPLSKKTRVRHISSTCHAAFFLSDFRDFIETFKGDHYEATKTSPLLFEQPATSPFVRKKPVGFSPVDGEIHKKGGGLLPHLTIVGGLLPEISRIYIYISQIGFIFSNFRYEPSQKLFDTTL